MEFNDLLGEGDFLDSYNKPSEVKGRVMQPKVRDDGYYFKLKELAEDSVATSSSMMMINSPYK